MLAGWHVVVDVVDVVVGGGIGGSGGFVVDAITVAVVTVAIDCLLLLFCFHSSC